MKAHLCPVRECTPWPGGRRPAAACPAGTAARRRRSTCCPRCSGRAAGAAAAALQRKRRAGREWQAEGRWAVIGVTSLYVFSTSPVTAGVSHVAQAGQFTSGRGGQREGGGEGTVSGCKQFALVLSRNCRTDAAKHVSPKTLFMAGRGATAGAGEFSLSVQGRGRGEEGKRGRREKGEPPTLEVEQVGAVVAQHAAPALQ